MKVKTMQLFVQMLEKVYVLRNIDEWSRNKWPNGSTEKPLALGLFETSFLISKFILCVCFIYAYAVRSAKKSSKLLNYVTELRWPDSSEMNHTERT